MGGRLETRLQGRSLGGGRFKHLGAASDCTQLKPAQTQWLPLTSLLLRLDPAAQICAKRQCPVFTSVGNVATVPHLPYPSRQLRELSSLRATAAHFRKQLVSCGPCLGCLSIP